MKFTKTPNKKLLLTFSITGLVSSLVVAIITFVPLLFNSFERSKFNFNSVIVDGEITAEASTKNLESLSAYQQPLFDVDSRSMSAKNLSRKENVNEDQEVEFDFYWNGVIEQYINPYLDYTNPDNLQYAESGHINDMVYTDDNGNEYPIYLEDHHFIINYLTLNFTNNQNERILIQKGSPEIPRFYPEAGCYSGGGGNGLTVNSGFVIVTTIPKNCEDFTEFDDYIIDPVEAINEYAIPQEDFTFEVLEDGINLKIKSQIDSAFNAQKVDISTIQIIGMQKNEDKKIRYVMLNFSSFGRNEKLSLSTIGLPYDFSMPGNHFLNTQTNNLYFDHYSRIHINDENEINIGYFKPLNEITLNSSNDIHETMVLFSNDPLAIHFDDLNFLGETNFSELMNQLTVHQDTNGLYSDESILGTFGSEILDTIKPIALIEFTLFNNNILNFNIKVTTPTSSEIFEFNEPIFDSVFNFNTGISVSNESYLMPLIVVGSGNNLDLENNTFDLTLYLNGSRIQNVKTMKDSYALITNLIDNPSQLVQPPYIYSHVDLKIYFWGFLGFLNDRFNWPYFQFPNQDIPSTFLNEIIDDNYLLIHFISEVNDNTLFLSISS
jgi:hypothetical protein